MMDLAWLAKVILIEDISLCFSSHSVRIETQGDIFLANKANLVRNFS
jgi:hypothetical protein